MAAVTASLTAAFTESDARRIAAEMTSLSEHELTSLADEAVAARSSAAASAPQLVDTDVTVAAISQRASAACELFKQRTAAEQEAYSAELTDLHLYAPSLAALVAKRREVANSVVRAIADYGGRLGPARTVAAAMEQEATRVAEWEAYLTAQEAAIHSEERKQQLADAIAAAEEEVRARVASLYSPRVDATRSAADEAVAAAKQLLDDHVRSQSLALETAQERQFEQRMGDVADGLTRVQAATEDTVARLRATKAQLSKVKELARLKASVRRHWASLDTAQILAAFGVIVKSPSQTALGAGLAASYSSLSAASAVSGEVSAVLSEETSRFVSKQGQKAAAAAAAASAVIPASSSPANASPSKASAAAGAAAVSASGSDKSIGVLMQSRLRLRRKSTAPATPSSNAAASASTAAASATATIKLPAEPTAAPSPPPPLPQSQPLLPSEVETAIARRCINAFLSAAIEGVSYDRHFHAVLTVANKVGMRQM